jgi:putative FmdB family regulatory protein
MPLYDFECGVGHRFERMVRLAAFADPQACACGASAVRLLSRPRIHSDAMEPFRGPDGRIHTSLATYRRACLPSGNPKGERYFEIGNEDVRPAQRDPRAEKAQRVEAIRRGIEDVRNGRIARPVELED